jgi:hypothetical protein
MPLKDRPKNLRSYIQFASEVITRAEFKAAFSTLKALIHDAFAEQNYRIDARLAQLKDGAQGPKGDKGDSVAGPRGPKGDKGDTGGIGPAPDTEPIKAAIIAEVSEYLEKNLPALGASIRDGLELLPPEQAIKPTAIAGMEQYVQELLKKHGAYLGSGGQSSISVMQSGTLKAQAAPTLNFKGVGAPTVTTGANGVLHLDFPSAGVTELAATETPDGSTTVFTFAAASAQPRYIVADNVWQKATTKSGTINWTWNSGTKQTTLSVTPQDDIYAIT